MQRVRITTVSVLVDEKESTAIDFDQPDEIHHRHTPHPTSKRLRATDRNGLHPKRERKRVPRLVYRKDLSVGCPFRCPAIDQLPKSSETGPESPDGPSKAKHPKPNARQGHWSGELIMESSKGRKKFQTHTKTFICLDTSSLSIGERSSQTPTSWQGPTTPTF